MNNRFMGLIPDYMDPIVYARVRKAINVSFSEALGEINPKRDLNAAQKQSELGREYRQAKEELDARLVAVLDRPLPMPSGGYRDMPYSVMAAARQMLALMDKYEDGEY